MSDPSTLLGFRVYTVAPGESSADLEVVVACVGSLALAFGLLVPLEWVKPFFGPCKFKVFTGFPCGTCGATRAVEALFAGQLAELFRINPFFAAFLLAGVGYVPVAWVLWLARLPRPRLGIPSRRGRWTLGIGLLLLFLANWVYLIVDGR